MYTFPSKDPYLTEGSNPDRLQLYETTAVDAVNTLSNSIMSFLLPLDQDWITLDVTESYKRKMPVLAFSQSLNLQQRLFFENLNNSDFYLAASESMIDCIVAGTGCLSIEMTDNGLKFQSIPMRQLFILDNGCDIDVVFRCHHLSVSKVIGMFVDNKVPDWLSQLETTNPDRKVGVIESMTPGIGKNSGKYDYCIHLEQDWSPVLEQITAHKPFITFRWSKVAGQVFGDSPVRQALPAIKVANAWIRQILDHGEFASSGAFQTSDESLKDIKFHGGDIVFVSDPDGIKPISFPGNFNISTEQLQDARNVIRTMLMADSLPQANASSRMTSDEVQQRVSQFFRRIGTTALRLEEELLEQIARNVILLLQTSGKLQKKLDDGTPFVVNGNPIILTTQSIVKKAAALKQVEQMLQLIQYIQPFGPNGMAHIDLSKTSRFILESGQFPPELLNDEQAVQKSILAQQMAQMAAGSKQIASGQGNEQTSAATGSSIAALLAAYQSGQIKIPPQYAGLIQSAIAQNMGGAGGAQGAPGGAGAMPGGLAGLMQPQQPQ